MNIIRDGNGVERRLGWVAPDAAQRKARATMTNIQELRATLVPNEPTVFTQAQIIAQLQKAACDFVTGFPSTLINNQGQEGACVGASCAGGSSRQLFIRTGRVIQMSWPYVYDQINGGQDNGANIGLAMGVMQGGGAPLLVEYPKSLWLPGKMPANATIFREDVQVTMGSALEFATGLLMGILGQAPIGVPQRESFDGNGVWSLTSSGNHSIYLAGIVVIAGKLYFLLVNSWDVTWGPFGNGTCLIAFSSIDACAQANDGFGHGSIVTPPGWYDAPMPQVSPTVAV